MGQSVTDDLKFLSSIVSSDRVSFGSSDLKLHSKDEFYHESHCPDVVVWPENSLEISEILKEANRRKIPVTPWGGGTSAMGNPVPVQGGIVLDMRRMSNILEMREKALQVRVQAGLEREKLNEHVANYGLFFAPDPSAKTAQIGGMIANNAGGARALRYGTTKDQVLQLELVLADGRIIRVGSQAVKSSSGYELVRLFTGSEGTLGVITEATLRLEGLPHVIRTGTVIFPSVDEASDAVSLIIQSGLRPAALELLDTEVLKLINRHTDYELEESPMLLVEFHGSSDAGLDEDLQFAREACQDSGCLEFRLAETAEERNLLWDARHSLGEVIIRQAGDHSVVLFSDVAVPISEYPKLVRRAQEIIRSQNLQCPYLPPYGHAGDGNLHLMFLVDPSDHREWDRVQSVDEEVVACALELGGTVTAELGVGLGKKRYMEQEHGLSLEIMRQIKALLDPNGIMNPGKIFP